MDGKLWPRLMSLPNHVTIAESNEGFVLSERSAIDVAAIAGAPALRRAEQHPAAGEIQRFLERYGYLRPGEAEPGVIDEATSRALIAYQRFHGLPETGDFEPVARDLMIKPRCGNADLVGGIAFELETPQDHLDLTFAFGRGTADLDGTLEFDPVRSAFTTWAATGHFAFREMGWDDNPDFHLSWTSPGDPDFDFPQTGDLAHASYPSAAHQHLHFNDWWNWNTLAYEFFSIDIETVALHEIGHLLGLKHSSVVGSVMQPEYDLSTEHRVLHSDDLAALDALYGTSPGRLASTVIIQVRQHFGNEPDSLPGAWVGTAKEYEFDVPRCDVRQPAYLLFQARAVSSELDVLTINGQPVPGGVPYTSGEEGWAAQVLLISPNVLTPVRNILRVESRDAAGGTGGDIDDFIIDNAVVLYLTISPGFGGSRPRTQFPDRPPWPAVAQDTRAERSPPFTT